mmetsp:Transcript_21013/g.29416  ORF Transcript_21013/g.29416 Transcript_21013/m.29416 type:complete len:343 (-) Transcript_21013:629-1657(-)
MLASFSSWVKKPTTEGGTKKNGGRVVIIGDHFPAVNESVRKAHWRAISSALEFWDAESKSTGKPTLIIGEKWESDHQERMPLDVQPGNEPAQSKREQRIDARQKAELAILSEHLRSKLAQHSQLIQAGDLETELHPGQQVRIYGLLSAPQYNGQLGKIGSKATDNGRYSVALTGQEKPFLLKRTNLCPLKSTKEQDEQKSSLEPPLFHVELADTFDLAYLGTFVVLAIKFWKPLGSDASKEDDGERMVRFIKNSHDITWSQLFSQVAAVLEGAHAAMSATDSKDLKAAFHDRGKVLSEKLKQAKAFCAKHAEDESERYSLTFFAAVRAEGDSALKQWCEWAV